jgi:hypothetical protein
MYNQTIKHEEVIIMCMVEAIPLLATAAGAGGAAAAGATTAGIIAAGALGAASGMQAQAGIDAADYNKQLAENQQEQLEAESENVRISGSQEAQTARQESQKQAARARTQFASGGVSTATGTPAEFGENVAEVGALDEATILNNAARQAFGLEVQGQNLVDKAKMDLGTAKKAGTSTILTSGFRGFTGGLA